jgi:glycosyltransferase involved in cell wall biosynthesis
VSPLVSIIICTRNRGNDLRWTLETIRELDVPSDLPAEVLVVDNGSTGHTPEVVHHIKMLSMPVRCVA